MHSYDRTLLAKLGFADPDKGDSRHDLACQYIGQPETVEKLARLLGIAHGARPFRVADGTSETMGVSSRTIRRRSIAYEMPIEKGSDQYKTTVGFADIVLCFELLLHEERIRCRRRRDLREPWDDWQHEEGGRMLSRAKVGVEVKIAPVPIGSLIRQINLYRSYTRPGFEGYGGIARWVVATDHDMPQVDLMSLKNERIVHVRLGQCFEEFVRICKANDAGEQVEI